RVDHAGQAVLPDLAQHVVRLRAEHLPQHLLDLGGQAGLVGVAGLVWGQRHGSSRNRDASTVDTGGVASDVGGRRAGPVSLSAHGAAVGDDGAVIRPRRSHDAVDHPVLPDDDARSGLPEVTGPALDTRPVTPRSLTLSISMLVTAMLLAVAALLPVPYAISSPGPTRDTLGTHDG